MSDADPSMFPGERRRRRRPFPLVPAILGLITLLVVSGFAAKAFLDKDERLAYAQAQSIGQAYFSALASDAKRYQSDLDSVVLEDPHPGMDFAWNRQQLTRMRATTTRYRAQFVERGRIARAAIAALKVRAQVRNRYLADVDKTIADKTLLLDKRLANQQAALTELAAMWDVLAGHPGQWGASASGAVAITNSALFPAYAQHFQAYGRLMDQDQALGETLLAPEMWVSPPP